MKTPKHAMVALSYFAILLLFAFVPVQAQETSRWALGRPSLLIDMPGEPAGGGVSWAEKPLYSIFPSSWSAEGGGIRVEVARIYTAQSPSQLLTSVGQKINASMSPASKGMISGRESLTLSQTAVWLSPSAATEASTVVQAGSSLQRFETRQGRRSRRPY